MTNLSYDAKIELIRFAVTLQAAGWEDDTANSGTYYYDISDTANQIFSNIEIDIYDTTHVDILASTELYTAMIDAGIKAIYCEHSFGEFDIEYTIRSIGGCLSTDINVYMIGYKTTDG